MVYSAISLVILSSLVDSQATLHSIDEALKQHRLIHVVEDEVRRRCYLLDEILMGTPQIHMRPQECEEYGIPKPVSHQTSLGQVNFREDCIAKMHIRWI